MCKKYLAYAFPANSTEVTNELDIMGYPFIRTHYSVNADCKNKKDIKCGWSAERLFFLGLTNSTDISTGSWSTPTGDHSHNFFIGDGIGEIQIVYEGGDADVIPLIIGFTAWWNDPWDPSKLPFSENESDRSKLNDSIFLYDIYQKKHGCYFMAFRPNTGKVIERITICNNPYKAGYPTLYGITVENPSNTAHLVKLTHKENKTAIKELTRDGLKDTLTVQKRIEALQRCLYTFEDSLPQDALQDIPEGYSAPEIHFSGNNYSRMLTNEYYHCLGDSILAGGPLECKANGFYWGFYNNSIGIYDRYGSAGGSTWTRDMARVIIERIKAGCLVSAGESLAIYDKMLYGHRNFTPEPLPHWIEYYFMNEEDIKSAGGYCHYPQSKATGEVVVGNLENDGHGLLIMARYRYWVQNKKDGEWLADNWIATRDAAEWICWQLDNPLDIEGLAVNDPDNPNIMYYDPVRRQFPDCLWCEGESGGYGGCDIWSNFACYTALLVSVEMAETKGETGLARRWSQYAGRLKKGMLTWLVEENPRFGPTWRYIPYCNWQDFNESLAPVISMADIMGLDISGMDPEMLQISKNTYKARIYRGKDGGKLYNFVRAFGYGQAFITEAALLLDEMEDATYMVENVAKYIYSPFYKPWICPEGTIVHESGKYWYRQNGLGNEIQISSIVRVMRYIAGVDDYNPERLKIIPRVPLTWTGVSVDKVPVVTKKRAVH